MSAKEPKALPNSSGFTCAGAMGGGIVFPSPSLAGIPVASVPDMFTKNRKRTRIAKANLEIQARVKDSMAEDQRRRVLAELSTCKNVLEHIRTNTQNVVKAASNSSWELPELRTGGTAKDSGEVDAQKGSLLATLGVLGENQMSATIEQLGKLAADLRDAIEKGTEPSKSLKRKHEEAEYAELLRQKEELQKEHERTKKYPITHPITQQQLFLTIDEQGRCLRI